MTVKAINVEPDASVVKKKVCTNCGATLEYVPNDVRRASHTDYTGCTDYWNAIDCPECDETLSI